MNIIADLILGVLALVGLLGVAFAILVVFLYRHHVSWKKNV